MPARFSNTELSAEQVRALLHYDSETGLLHWAPRPREMFPTERSWKIWNSRFANTEAFSAVGADGYRRGAIFYRSYLAHRVAWLIHTGSWPCVRIDHIDGARSNNRFDNLRLAPGSENARNTRRRSDNTSGVTGVIWNKLARKWEAYIAVNSKKIHLGLFDTLEEASSARKAANDRLGFSERHGAAA